MKKIISCLLLLLFAMGTVSAWGWYSSSCTDSDGGKNYDEKGEVEYRGRTYTDSCNGNKVKEYYCRYNRYKSYTYYTCPDGCSDGACITIPIIYCGDGVVNQPLEQCDDGNTQNGDGCDSNCQLESCVEDWECTEWGECTGSSYWNIYKKRDCTDLNSCGTTYTKPSTREKCKCYNGWAKESETIDVGNPTSEVGHNLQGFSAIEPATSGGLWGKASGANSCCPYGNVNFPNAYDGSLRYVDNSEASFTINFGGTDNRYNNNNLQLMVLMEQGLNESFELYISDVLIYTFIDDGLRNNHCDNGEWKQFVFREDDLTALPSNARDHVGGIREVKIKSLSDGRIPISEVFNEWEKSQRFCS